MVDSLLISNVHEQLFPALAGAVEVTKPQAVGVVEFYSVASAILAADRAAKAAQITLIEVRIGYAIGERVCHSYGRRRSCTGSGGSCQRAGRTVCGKYGHSASFTSRCSRHFCNRIKTWTVI